LGDQKIKIYARVEIKNNAGERNAIELSMMGQELTSRAKSETGKQLSEGEGICR
jgi:hypothetical protein